MKDEVLKTHLNEKALLLAGVQTSSRDLEITIQHLQVDPTALCFGERIIHQVTRVVYISTNTIQWPLIYYDHAQWNEPPCSLVV